MPHAPFLQDILARPSEDAPRLVYADWLDEHGEPERAELIRAQVALARGVSDVAARERLRERERQLLAEHESRWTAPLHGLVRRARFRRGFPECVTLPAEWFLTRGAELFRLAPVRHVILTNAANRLPALADSPSLGKVETLECRTPAGGDVRELLRSPHLGSIRELILRYGGVEDDGAAALAGTPGLKGLRGLDLYGCSIGLRGLDALAGSAHLAGLHSLVLGDDEGNGDNWAAALAAPASRLASLARLHLSFSGLGPAGASALASTPRLASLRELDLGFNRVGAAGARALAGSPHLQGLTRLGLRGNSLSRAVREELATRLAGRVHF